MNVIGISGLDSAVAFKKRHWPGLTEREYRISQGHDSAAALVVDGTCVAAAAEERFSRRKHTGDFPANAIRYCLAEAGMRLEDIDEFSHAFDYAPYRTLFALDPISNQLYKEVLCREALLDHIQRHFPEFPAERVQSVGHHLAHAASAYFTSGWDECLILVTDGMGEVESLSVYAGRNGGMERIMQLGSGDSLGILYSLVTLHLGFDFNADEYKIMGLAPYGDPARFRGFFTEHLKFCDDGSVRIPILRLGRSRSSRENYTEVRQYLEEHLVPARQPEDEILDVHRDVAAALQECLDRAFLHTCGHFRRATGFERLVMAGGVALNCTANGRLLDSGLFREIYVQPAAGDDGAALGAALYRTAVAGRVSNSRLPVPFLGPAYTPDEVETALTRFRDRVVVTRFSNIAETAAVAAKLIANGGVIAWYRGRMEFGPRALGHRSILADPGHPEMRDRINSMVKMREAFRPFAPAVSIEQVHQWFEVPAGTSLPYMIMTVDVRESYRAELPAVTHVNGSARVQTVSAADNADFHTLLREVGVATGREIVLNTSFNIKGQPIVNTPAEALETFLNTGIDCLFLEDRLIERRGD